MVAERGNTPPLMAQFFKKDFLMWTIFFLVFIEFVTVLLLFIFWGFLATRHVGS